MPLYEADGKKDEKKEIIYRKEAALLGKTHLMVGIATTMVVTQPTSGAEMISAVGGGALGALISDIDVR